MARTLKIVLYCSVPHILAEFFRRTYHLYREASLHEIRKFGGASLESGGVEFCSFKFGDFKYEVYAPSPISRLKVVRKKLVKNADGIVFILPSHDSTFEATSSHLLDLRMIVAERYGDRIRDIPIIYAVEAEDTSSIHRVLDTVNIDADNIVVGFSFRDNQTIRRIFGKITLLAMLREIDRRKYYWELDRMIQETRNFLQAEKHTEEELRAPEFMEEIPSAPEIDFLEYIESQEEIREESRPKFQVLKLSRKTKLRLLRNYIAEALLLEFDPSIGYIPTQMVFGNGKIIKYAKDPVNLAELSIIAKHSMGFLLADGVTFIGFVKLDDNRFIAMETTVSHIKKICNIIRLSNDIVENLSLIHI